MINNTIKDKDLDIDYNKLLKQLFNKNSLNLNDIDETVGVIPQIYLTTVLLIRKNYCKK